MNQRYLELGIDLIIFLSMKRPSPLVFVVDISFKKKPVLLKHSMSFLSRKNNKYGISLKERYLQTVFGPTRNTKS